MPTLYIHAGTPKTGTTALQSFLGSNRALLTERARLYYPKTGMASNFKSEMLFPIQPKKWNCLHEEVSAFPACDVILSEERVWIKKFQDLLPPHFEIIRRTFPGYDIKIVVYVRRIDDFLKSFFNQRAKGGRTTANSYADFFQQIYNGEDGTLFFSQPLSAAAGLVGRENLLLGIYDKSSLRGGDIITDFFSLLGREIPEGTIPAPNTNPSLPDEALPLLSPALLPLPLGNPLRMEIVNILRQAYSFTKGSGVGDEYLAEFNEEINKIDAYVPGYKKMFAERPLSFSFPEVDVKNPQLLFIASLLYKLLIAQRGDPPATLQGDYGARLDALLSSRSWRYTAPLRRVKEKIKWLINRISA